MEDTFSNKAALPNHALKKFGVLIGQWKTTGTHPYLPGATLYGHVSFKWLEGGSFLIMHSEVAEPNFPDGIAIIGSDDVSGEYFMLYFDERNVSRKYDVSFSDNILKWWRNTPEFSQRYTWKISDDGQTIISKGELSKDNGSAWEKDLEQTFIRIK
jgi:hypothetical protein